MDSMTDKNNELAVGVFDSGVGGLTVLRALVDRVPNENYIYFGDTARFPYGSKTPDELRQFVFEIIGFLVEKGVKIVVIACNSASSAALTEAQTHFDIPVIGVIEPGARAALIRSQTRHIGVIGSTATVESGAYRDAVLNLDAGAKVYERACPDLADFAERGEHDSPELRATLTEYLAPLIDEKVDSLILGCTHYPLLAGAVEVVAGPGVTLISSAEETARELAEILSARHALRDAKSAPSLNFYTTNHSDKFHDLSREFFGSPIERIETVSLDQRTVK